MSYLEARPLEVPDLIELTPRRFADERGFFGRADILRVAEIELSDPNRNALVLFGQRRIGKTSILLQLQRRLSPPRFLPVLFDLQDRARQPLGQLLADLADAIAETVEIEPGERSGFDDLGVSFRNSFLPRLYAALAPEQSPALVPDGVTQEYVVAPWSIVSVAGAFGRPTISPLAIFTPGALTVHENPTSQSQFATPPPALGGMSCLA